MPQAQTLQFYSRRMPPSDEIFSPVSGVLPPFPDALFLPHLAPALSRPVTSKTKCHMSTSFDPYMSPFTQCSWWNSPLYGLQPLHATLRPASTRSINRCADDSTLRLAQSRECVSHPGCKMPTKVIALPPPPPLPFQPPWVRYTVACSLLVHCRNKNAMTAPHQSYPCNPGDRYSYPTSRR